ncbi:YciI family protein [Stappia sp. MMSF_3263]|uniref:YciI family protein n=1 Tax=Stappia sp. MMSF_3263 TaxID=3046693 RepID=UPI00273E7A6A|nr:YciI family protein [Stappia sp. MMSF_3263]
MPLIAEGQNLFIVDIEYVVPLGEVEPLIPDHVAFLERNYAQGRFLASGAKVPRTGGVIVAVAQSRESVEEIIGADPFHARGIARYTITEFRPTRTAPGLAG